MKQLKVCCPCKINLSLDITGLRGDGYHLMRMVMQSVSLCDTLSITANNRGDILVECAHPSVPRDGRNIAHRCAVAFFKALGEMPYGVTLGIEKKIPSKAGLGGGSADGAGTLLGLNILLGAPFSHEKLCEIAGGVGADLPFCLTGGTALVEGIGEKITPLPPLPDCYVLLTKPQAGVSTPACFAAYDAMGGSPGGGESTLLSGLASGQLPQVGQGLYNVLELPAGLEEIAALKSVLLSWGAVGALMSGSGSAVFGLFEKEKEALVAAKALSQDGHWNALARPLSRGVYLL